MATGTVTSRSAGVHNFATGGFTGDATITTITLGFTPRYFKLFNATDAITWEKFENMGATITAKTVTAGTLTADATSAVLFSAGGVVTLSAALAASAKVCSWVAMA